MTPRQLVDAWRAKKGAKAMPDEVVGENDRPPKALSRSACERLVLQLLVRLVVGAVATYRHLPVYVASSVCVCFYFLLFCAS